MSDRPRHPAPARLDPFSTGTGLSLVGAGLVALAVVEAVNLIVRQPAARESMVAPEPTLASWAPATLAIAPQSAVGTGPGAPSRQQSSVPPASGQLVGIAANPIPNGTAIYRMWSSGRVEAMIATEESVWSEWVVAAPGLSTDMRRPRNPGSNPDASP
ncbi:MAG: hypothetical protein RI990_1665 [Planctomycetota bacterium]|jgi:hypothetical protein